MHILLDEVICEIQRQIIINKIFILALSKRRFVNDTSYSTSNEEINVICLSVCLLIYGRFLNCIVLLTLKLTVVKDVDENGLF
jgi:hypothetical protein